MFGCGHPDWASTFYAIPTLIDEKLDAAKGNRLLARGKGNVASADLFDQFDEWKQAFFKTIAPDGDASATKATLDVQIDSAMRTNLLRHDFLKSATVVSNQIISRGNTDIKRQILIDLPENMTYRTGDYLGVLPVTPAPVVSRVLRRFGLHGDDLLTLVGHGVSSTSLPLDKALSAFDLFAGFFELEQPASRSQLQLLQNYTEDETVKATLTKYMDPDFYASCIAGKRVSLLSLLEEFPQVSLPVSEFILQLQPLHMRQYSISSSPMNNASQAALTISIIDAPHLSGRGERYLGTASHFLSILQPGSKIRAGVRASSAGFHPPSDPTVPIIMAASGSGIAPFRAFVQERALQK